MKASNRTNGYMPTLDGWRAISIILVVLAHAKANSGLPVLGSILRWGGVYGGTGVSIFFAISGLLICGRLIQEERKNGSISLRNFYLRRASRILPPVLLYLLVLACLSRVLGTTKLEFISSLLFFRNYVLGDNPIRHWYTFHFWSLAVEEHFYLLLPGILVFFPRWRSWVLGFLTATVILWRFWIFHSGGSDFGTRRTDTVIDALLIAALFAIAAGKDGFSAFIRRYSSSLVTLAILCAFMVMQPIHVPFSQAIQATMLPLLILSTTERPESIVARFLEWAPLKWLGRLSYSLYLWQQMFFKLGYTSPILGPFQAWPFRLIGLVCCASLSYYLLERPMIRLGHRLASSGVPGRAIDQTSNSSASPPVPLEQRP